MSGKPDTARNWKRAGGAWLLSALLLVGSAGAYDFEEATDAPATLDGYGERDAYPSNDPDYGGLRLLDPGYAFSVYDIYGYPGAGVRDYGWAGNYGYPAHGGYPGYGYGPVTRSNSSPPYGDAPNSGVTSDRAYIRQLEERIRKLELANKQQQLPPYGARPNIQSWPQFNPTQPGYEPPAAGQLGQQPTDPGGNPGYSGHSDYPTFQPSYGGPPTYRFR
jgi:hypothetical protein